ncbi:iron-containing alcohol dehydrogenase [Carboxylicivirga linearis]|uniref:Iron-containing alcohol dehydrogenase n=1 Tax=Carboxylicivirga linearis TaxID=1628157 RepID=A0ABS5JXW2_9BACT|nr:iron-containing alcohol dehydrogenase [Carboxylicivirga linearis]MBS2099711.1 iron-containing alcohol dehydrogenase [Carboxylicivirga linearis]
MNNFHFHNPVKILFGKGELSNFKDEIPAGSKVMMLYGGGSIKKNGVYDKVTEQLSGFDVTEFGGIEANPKYETLMKAVEVVREKNIDFLLAVGGGSVVDGTKFVSAAAHYPNGDPWNILAKGDVAGIVNPLPIGAVLTLPATGSEMNGNSVVSKIETKEKLAFGTPLVMPQFSVLDPTVIASLPERQIANGIVDAFVHVMEQYLTYPVNAPIQDRFAEGILSTLIEEGPKVLKDPTDYDSAANFMWAATMALNGLIATGVPQDWSTHMIGHELTALHGIDHARTLAVVLPGVMKVMLANKKEKILQYGAKVWDVTKGTEDEKVEATIQKTVDFFESVGIQTRGADYELKEDTVSEVCQRFEQRGVNALGEKGDLTVEKVKEILETQL